MGKTLLCVKREKSENSKRKNSNFPTIQRQDIMECILSDAATEKEKALLSSMYSEIIRMETKKMKYITEIAISSKEEAHIYDLVNHLKIKERKNVQ